MTAIKYIAHDGQPHYHRSHIAVTRHVVYDLAQAHEHVVSERVQRCRLVQGDGGDVIGFFEQDKFVVHGLFLVEIGYQRLEMVRWVLAR